MRISLPSRFIVFLFMLAFCALGIVDASAAIRRVPTDYPTIQQAINASVNGDTVLVSPGTYLENINFLGKAITVSSESGPGITIIDGNHAGSVVTFRSGESRSSILSGFTIRNGRATFDFGYSGGGVHIERSSATVRNNIITNNIGMATGGGIGMIASSALIQGNVITNNRTEFSGTSGGGIIVSFSSDVEVVDNVISRNTADFGGGLYVYLAERLAIRNNRIQENTAFYYGGGIFGTGYPFSIIQNLIARNSAQAGGGIYGYVGDVINNTIADNDSQQGSGVNGAFNTQNKWVNNLIVAKAGQDAAYMGFGDNSGLMLMNNNIYSSGGSAYGGGCPNLTGINGNISADPLFVNAAAGDYHLKLTSPSIDTGDNSAPNLPSLDLEGKPRIQDGNHDGIAVVDMGAYEAPPPFDLCIQDESNGNLLQINSTTGDYQFTNCAGLTIGGIGTLTKRGSQITLQHNAADRRVMASLDTSAKRATASIQLLSQGRMFSITDRNITNNSCACR
ncbi:MAG: serine protease [Blastocatellia bacterium]